MQEAEACLADDVAGAAARAYLAGRGLRPATWQAWRLGFHHAWHPVRREALPAITLPWFGADGTLQAVQYRYFGPGIARHDRFGQKAGGQRSLFGLQRLSGRATLIVTEGELNAISCWQVAAAWADVLSIGSQENVRQARVSEALKGAALPYRWVIAWLDERERALTAGRPDRALQRVCGLVRERPGCQRPPPAGTAGGPSGECRSGRRLGATVALHRPHTQLDTHPWREARCPKGSRPGSKPQRLSCHHRQE